MNKYERKVCQKAEYYRMTGVRYRFGFKAIVRYMLFHQLSFMWWFRKCQQKEGSTREYDSAKRKWRILFLNACLMDSPRIF